MKKNKSPAQKALEEAIELAGGQSELARKITIKSGEVVRQQHVWNWLNREELPPAKKTLYIEMVTGVPKERLRPDIYPSAITNGALKCDLSVYKNRPRKNKRSSTPTTPPTGESSEIHD